MENWKKKKTGECLKLFSPLTICARKAEMQKYFHLIKKKLEFGDSGLIQFQICIILCVSVTLQFIMSFANKGRFIYLQHLYVCCPGI